MEEMDKLLEDLQKVNVDFNNQLSKYEALIYHTEQTNEKLDKYTESNREKVDRLCIRVEKRLEEMNSFVEGMFAESRELIEQYAKDVPALNEKERQTFSQMLLGELEQYKEEFLSDVSRLTETAKENNQEMLTQVQGLRLVVNGCLDAINHSIGSINDRYIAIFEEFSKRVNVLNEEERKTFMRELSRTLEGYKKDYGICDELLKDSHKTNQELTRLTLQNVENVQEIERQIDRNLEQSKELLEHMNKAYREGFSEFAKDVTALNEREKEQFVVTIRSVLEDYRFTFGNEIEGKTKELNHLFQSTLAGVCNNFTAQNQEYQKQLEEMQVLVNSLLFREKTIKEALSFLKEDYKNTVWQYVQELERNNASDREKIMQNTIQSVNAGSEKFSRQMEAFKAERSKYLQQMEQLLEEEKKDRESMLNRQAESINLLKREQEALKRQLTEKQESINRYQLMTGGVTLGFMTICLLLLFYIIEPKVFAIVCLLVVVALGVVLTLNRKQIIQWFDKNKKQEGPRNFDVKDGGKR